MQAAGSFDRPFLENISKGTTMDVTPVSAFIREKGYAIEQIDLDGNFHEWRDEHGRKGWYIGTNFDSGLTTFTFGDWRDPGSSHHFTSKDNLTVDEQAVVGKFKLQVEKNRDLKHRRTQVISQELWTRYSRLGSDGESKYLTLKKLPQRFQGLNPQPVIKPSSEMNARVLTLPMFDNQGELWNLQSVFDDGSKAFQPGGRTDGLRYVFGSEAPLQSEFLFVCEGWATGYALWLATGIPVVCAFSSSNLKAIVSEYVEKLGSQRVILAADWDRGTELKLLEEAKSNPKVKPINPGAREAQNLTSKYKIRVVMPFIGAVPERNVDFCDLWTDAGGAYVLECAREAWVPGQLGVLSGEQPDSKSSQGGSTPSTPAKQETPQEHFEKVHWRISPYAGMSDEKVAWIKNQPEVKAAAARVQEAQDRISKIDHGLLPISDSKQELVTLEPIVLNSDARLLPEVKPGNYKTIGNGFFATITDDEGKEKHVPDFNECARYLDEYNHLLTNDAFTYIYRDGYYQMITKLELFSTVRDMVRQNIKPSVIDQFVQHVRAENFVRSDELSQVPGFINLENGILDVRTRTMQPHTYRMFFKYKLPHSYEPGRECPCWLDYLKATFEGNQELIDVSAELFGYILVGGNPFLHKAFVLFGDGRDGKSTYLDVLRRLVGSSNYSAVPIANLDKPFSVVMTDGKLVNIVGETTPKEISSDAFKTAVGGEELIAAQKGTPEYPLKFNTRLVFACNKLPYLGDTTTGAYEKFFIIPFPRYLHDENRIWNYAERFLYPEMPGIINWALDGLERLVKRGALPKIGVVHEQIQDFREETDTVFSWMREYVEVNSEVTERVQFKDHYQHYRSFCDAQGRLPVAMPQFSKRIAGELRKYPHILTSKPKNVVTYTKGVRVLTKPFEIGALNV